MTAILLLVPKKYTKQAGLEVPNLGFKLSSMLDPNKILRCLSDAPFCKLELDRFSVQLKIQDGAECANRELTIVREGIGKIMCFSASYNLVLLSQSP